jgi:hypothetical protein
MGTKRWWWRLCACGLWHNFRYCLCFARESRNLYHILCACCPRDPRPKPSFSFDEAARPVGYRRLSNLRASSFFTAVLAANFTCAIVGGISHTSQWWLADWPWFNCVYGWSEDECAQLLLNCDYRCQRCQNAINYGAGSPRYLLIFAKEPDRCKLGSWDLFTDCWFDRWSGQLYGQLNRSTSESAVDCWPLELFEKIGGLGLSRLSGLDYGNRIEFNLTMKIIASLIN